MKNHLIRFLTAIILILSNYTGYTQGLVINEIVSNNKNGFTSLDQNHYDWIELFNNSSNNINLLNYSLSDDNENFKKWLFPEVIVPPNGYILVYASGQKNLLNSELHANFKIKKSGEPLYLSDANGVLISSMSAVELGADQSYSRVPDGSSSTFSILNTPTPPLSAINNSSITASLGSGYYEKDTMLNLTCSDNSHEIYYTLNGAIPSTEGLKYEGFISLAIDNFGSNDISLIPTTPLEGPSPLPNHVWKTPKNVNKAHVVRFAAFKDGVIKSQIYNSTFFINPQKSERYTLPVISLITDSINLFDYEKGIYIPGKRFDEEGFNWWPIGNYLNRGRDWEKVAHLSYFDTKGNIGFKTKVGIRMKGGGSTSNPQKSLNLYFREEYGLKKLEYPVFKNSENTNFKRLAFRNSGNDFLKTHFKDAMLQSVFKQFNLDIQEYSPSVLFINGEYWGIHIIREKFDKYYFKYKFGIDEDNVNILGVCGKVEEGDNEDYMLLTNYFASNDISDAEHYEFIKGKLDIENFIDYHIAEIYYANYDWPCNNYKIWKTNDANSKWRHLIYDLDLSFAYDARSSFYTPSLLHAAKEENGWPHCSCSNLMFRSLLENEEFQKEFITRFVYHLENAFKPSNIQDSINHFKALLHPEMKEHIDRWGYPKSMDDWYNKIEPLNEFALNRSCYMKEHLMDFFEVNNLNFDCEAYNINATSWRKIKLSPNPNDGNFQLTNNNLGDLTGFITVTDMAGKIILREENFTIKGFTRKLISIPNLSKGAYILSIRGKNVSEARRFIVSK